MKCALAVSAAILAAAVGWLGWQARGLPATADIRARLFERPPAGQRTWLPLWAISPRLQTAVVLWEDPAFFHHSGLSYREIVRAALIDLRSASYQRGASTITQQVARNLFLSSEKTLSRKFREAILARRIERALSKEDILTVYLNIAQWGEDIVGAEAASRRYFSKPASDLTWAEAALLAGILPNPRQWNPCANPEQALRQRHTVLTKLLASGDLTPQEFRIADAAPLSAACSSSGNPRR